jgi:peptidoglycan-N-acetylglucosamine deacetylase
MEELNPRPPLSRRELRARRAARRREVRRRRLLLSTTIGLLALLTPLVAFSLGGSAASRHPRSRAKRPARADARRSSTGRPSAPTPEQQEQQTNRHILSYTSYVSLGRPRGREIALTFDDGPGPYTPRILSVLERFHVKATFFEIGVNVQRYPQFTARLAKAGMVIGDHTQDHPPMAQLDAAGQAHEIDEDANAIHEAGAPRPLLFRPPYGSFDATTLRLLRERNMVMVLWAVDTSDYALPGVHQIIATALGNARPGAVILFHDGGGDRSQTVAALPRIIKRLRRHGYRLVTVPELLRDDPPPHGQSPPVSLIGD